MLCALDLATITGFAVHDGTTIVAAGIRQLLFSGEADGMRTIRLGKLLDELLEQYSFDRIAFEMPGKMYMRAAYVLGGLSGKVAEWCVCHHPIDFCFFSPATIKKLATGKGNCDKGAMFQAALARWPDVPLVDHNQADAMWLAELAVARTKEKST